MLHLDASDTNLDGELSIDEIQAFIDQVIDITADGQAMTMITEVYSMLVNCIDTDGDSLSRPRAEFSDFYMAITSSDDDNGMLVFCMFDADGDGSNDSEYTDYLNSSDYDNGGEPMTEEEWESFVMYFNNYDTDGSGGLDFNEFETMIIGRK